MNKLFGFKLSDKLDEALEKTTKKFQEMSSGEVIDLGKKYIKDFEYHSHETESHLSGGLRYVWVTYKHKSLDIYKIEKELW